MRSAEVLRREGQQRFQEVLVILVQRRVAPPPLRVPQRLGVVGLAVRLNPVVDALPRHPEHAGEVGDGAAAVELEDGQGAPQHAGVQRL